MRRTLSPDPATIALIRALYASGAGRELRLRNRLSLADFGRPAGVSAPTIWKFEQQLRSPRADTAMKLAPVIQSLLELEAVTK